MNGNRARKPAAIFFPVLIGIGTIFLVFVIITNSSDSGNYVMSMTRLRYPLSGGVMKNLDIDLNEYNVKTHKGYVTMEELNEKVYKPLGYEISEPTLPVPTLRMINEPTCEMIFSEWFRVSQEPQPKSPPRRIPSGESDAFLLFGYAALDLWYSNDRGNPDGEHPRRWDEISRLMELEKNDLANLAYPVESASVYHAMDAHRLDNQTGAIIGSMRPWVEVMALRHGAKHILTVEYYKLDIQKEFQDRISSIFPIDLVKNWGSYSEKFDWVASFSSIEHSGLGRYGDPMDPIGDLREMLKIRCILKKGGLLFLGVPLGTDAIQFNVHRIYGPVRLALMFYGFEWVDTFSGTEERKFDLNSKRLHPNSKFGAVQHTIVLRKL